MLQFASKLTKYLWVLLLVIMIHSAAYCSQSKQLEDVVYLKDGSAIRGTIVEQVPGKSLKIETRDGNTFVFRLEEVERFTKEPVRNSASKRQITKKNGGVAFLWSLLIPGGGQFYNGENGKGAFMLGMSTVGFFILLRERSQRANTSDNMGEMLIVGGSLWSLIDAPISSARINRDNYLASAYRISDKLYVYVGMPVFGSQETSFVRAIVLF